MLIIAQGNSRSQTALTSAFKITPRDNGIFQGLPIISWRKNGLTTALQHCKNSKNAIQWLTSAIWRIILSVRLNVLLYPELAKKQENEETNNTTIIGLGLGLSG